MATNKTREELEKMTKAEIAAELPGDVNPEDFTKAELIAQALGEVTEGPQDTPDTPPATDPAPTDSDAAADPSDPDTPPPAEDDGEPKDPLAEQAAELDVELGTMYDGLVEKIKEAGKNAGPESAEQIRTGAVQFLREANAVLGRARAFLDAAQKVVEVNNKQLQGIANAKADLERRSADYRRMTTGGVKNADVQE